MQTVPAIGGSGTSTGVTLIGPSGVGKEAVGRRLAADLGLPFHNLPADAHRYRALTAFDPVRQAEIYHDGGYEAVVRYLMPINARIVEMALADYGPGVIRFGELHSIYEEPDVLERVRKAMEPYNEVVLLLPCVDVTRAAQVMRDRVRILYHGMDWNAYFVRNPSNRRLAKVVVYTEDLTPDETVEAILARIDAAATTILLLGPVGVGKTTVGARLSARLGLPLVSMDAIRRRYYAEAGYSEEEEQAIRAQAGFAGVLDYWKRFDLHAIRRALEEHPDSIIDVGAGQTVFEDEADLQALVMLLAAYPNVILLLPSPDIETTLTVLDTRLRRRTAIRGVPLDVYLLTHPANRTLATRTVYTVDRTPAEIAVEIRAFLMPVARR